MRKSRDGHYTVGGKPKVRYCKSEADLAASRINAQDNITTAHSYVCNWCEAWHVTGGRIREKNYRQTRVIHRWVDMTFEMGERVTGCLAAENNKGGQYAIHQRYNVIEMRKLLAAPPVKRGSIKGI